MFNVRLPPPTWFIVYVNTVTIAAEGLIILLAGIPAYLMLGIVMTIITFSLYWDEAVDFKTGAKMAVLSILLWLTVAFWILIPGDHDD